MSLYYEDIYLVHALEGSHPQLTEHDVPSPDKEHVKVALVFCPSARSGV